MWMDYFWKILFRLIKMYLIYHIITQVIFDISIKKTLTFQSVTCYDLQNLKSKILLFWTDDNHILWGNNHSEFLSTFIWLTAFSRHSQVLRRSKQCIHRTLGELKPANLPFTSRQIDSPTNLVLSLKSLLKWPVS